MKDCGKSDEKITRRDFMNSAAAVAAFTIVPRKVLGGPRHIPPSEKLNIAGVGIGGRGAGDLHEVGSENIVALCDVDDKYAAKVYKSYPNAKKYHDFRKMLDKEKNIDAVVISQAYRGCPRGRSSDPVGQPGPGIRRDAISE
jgi:hypothetical protein